ncbi:MAG TPA: hypothetical protein VI749_00465 [Candidatus Omnitrophota bacterium]|nr:hypothetical protein [Candidatus Omnitrophota bacterium]
MLLFAGPSYADEAKSGRGTPKEIEIYVGGKKIDSLRFYQLKQLKSVIQEAVEKASDKEHLFRLVWEEVIAQRLKGFTEEELRGVIEQTRWPQYYIEGDKEELMMLLQMAQTLLGSSHIDSDVLKSIDPNKIKTVEVSSAEPATPQE